MTCLRRWVRLARRLRLEVEEQRNARVIAPHGDLDLVSAPSLRRAISESNDRLLIVDLSWTEFMDSTGLAALFFGWKRGVSRFQRFVVVCPPDAPFRRLFRAAGLAARMEIVVMRDDAFKPPVVPG